MRTWINDWTRRIRLQVWNPRSISSLCLQLTDHNIPDQPWAFVQMQVLFFVYFVLFVSLFVFYLVVLGLHCGAQASCCGGFPCWGTRVPECGGWVAAVCGLSCSAACGILVPWPGIKSASPCIERQILKPWITREPPPPRFPILNVVLFSGGSRAQQVLRLSCDALKQPFQNLADNQNQTGAFDNSYSGVPPLKILTNSGWGRNQQSIILRRQVILRINQPGLRTTSL